MRIFEADIVQWMEGTLVLLHVLEQHGNNSCGCRGNAPEGSAHCSRLKSYATPLVYLWAAEWEKIFLYGSELQGIDIAMQIFANSITGKFIALEVEPTQTVDDLLVQIQGSELASVYISVEQLTVLQI